MVGVEVREEKADGQGVDILSRERVQRACEGFFVERLFHRAIRPNALGDAKPQVARHQRLHRLHTQVVTVFLQALAHFEQVPKALGCDEADTRAFAFHQRVGGYRGAVYQHLGLGEQLFYRQVVGGGRLPEAAQHTFRRVRRGRCGLELAGRAAVLDHHEIG